ncbi:MAG: PilZ domain-containing protein [Deltaproteobacteria bacterium]|nr:PilZ domain-containing protein [Deltaproteobacteria bacterium]
MGKERRKDRRLDTRIWVKESGERYVCYHLVSNLSCGGYFIEKKLPFPIGAEINVMFELPGESEPLNIKGVIVNNYRDADSAYKGAGVRFTGLSESDEKSLADFLAKVKNVKGKTGQ